MNKVKKVNNKVKKKLSKVENKINAISNKVNKIKPKTLSNVVRAKAIERNKRAIGSKLDVNPTSLINKGMAEKFRTMKIAEYLFGATHPKYAVENMLDVKLPTDLPVPTACIRVTKTVQLTTGASGVVMLNYLPGSLIRTNFSQASISALTFNTTGNGNGTAGSNTFVNFDSSNLTQVWDKWRLTASEMSLRYNGQVLQQSGTMFSCVHYEPSCIAVKGSGGAGLITGQTNSNVDRLSSDFALIKQGLWNSTINLAQEGAGITHIWTPSSALDYFFLGSSGTSSSDSLVISGNTLETVNTSTAASTSTRTNGAARQFTWACENLPANTNCLLFEVHEIYEYIPDISVVGILKPTTERPSVDEYSHVIGDGQVKLENKPLKSGGFFTALQKAVSNISREVDMPKLLATVGKTLVSMI